VSDDGAPPERPLRVAVIGAGPAGIYTADALTRQTDVPVSVDLVDRPYCQVDLPDEMLEHFFRSLALEARITLHNLVHRGKNFHHINEATFKAFGMALRQATRPAGELQSTKGKVHWKK